MLGDDRLERRAGQLQQMRIAQGHHGGRPRGLRQQGHLAEEAELNGQGFTAADWPYWESKVRARDFSLDEEELRQYFPLDNVLTQGVFAAAERLYGITVAPREDLEGYAEGVRVWDESGKEYMEAVAGLWCASLGFSDLASSANTLRCTGTFAPGSRSMRW